MFNFVKNSLKELEHVVWPTNKETNRYMTYTISVIIVMTVFLSIMGYLLRSGLVEIRNMHIFPQAPKVLDTDAPMTQDDLDTFLKENNLKATASGAVDSGAVDSGAVDSGAVDSGITVSDIMTTENEEKKDDTENAKVPTETLPPTQE